MDQQLAKKTTERVIRETIYTVSLLNSFNPKRAYIGLTTTKTAKIYSPVCAGSVLPGHWVCPDGGTLQGVLNSGNLIVAILIAYDDEEAQPIRPGAN